MRPNESGGRQQARSDAAVRPPSAAPASIAYLLAATAVVLLVGGAALGDTLIARLGTPDFWEHSAAIAAWKRDLAAPGNPHLAIDVGSVRYMPYFLVLTVAARTFDLDPIQALGVGAVLNTILLAIGVRLFFPARFGGAWTALLGLVVLLCAWGAGWLWSNEYQLQSLLMIAAYPSTHVFAVGFTAFWLAQRRLQQGRHGAWAFVVLGLLVAYLLVSHALTGAFVLATIGLMALLEPGAKVRDRAGLFAALLAATLLTEAWPYFSTWRVVLGVHDHEPATWVAAGRLSATVRTSVAAHPFYDPAQVLVTLGPALLGLPALVAMVWRRELLFVPVAFGCFLAIYLLNLVYPIPLGHRFLLFAVVFLHLGLTWWARRSARAWRRVFVTRETALWREPRVLAWGLLLVVAVGWNAALAKRMFEGRPVLSDRAWEWGDGFHAPVVERMRQIAAQLPEGAVVMARGTVGWPLPTFGGKVVTLHHPNPLVPDHRRRRADVERFFDRAATPAIRAQILRRYGVTHVLFDPRVDGHLAPALEGEGEIVLHTEAHRLVRLAPDAAGGPR